MARAWLSLGANLGEPERQLGEAVARLDAHPAITVTRQSAVHRTAPWGKTDQNDFYNMALELETDSSPEELLALCQGIETELGRIRREHWGPRVIDIDIIAYERRVLSSERLTLPHPFAHERDFVLVPLREIAPDTADWLVERIRSAASGPAA